MLTGRPDAYDWELDAETGLPSGARYQVPRLCCTGGTCVTAGCYIVVQAMQSLG